MTKRTTNVDMLVFFAAIWFFSVWAGYNVGLTHGLGLGEPKKCATVEGKEVVSTTADTCTYATSYGRATMKRRAM